MAQIQDRPPVPQVPARPDRLTVYFDGACPLCTAEVRHYARQPGGDRLDFVDVSRDGVNPGPDLSPGDAMRRFHVRHPDGTLLSGARAFVAIWQVLPRWRWAARVAGMPGMPRLLELAYRGFLPVRPLLSRVAALLGARPARDCPAHLGNAAGPPVKARRTSDGG